MSALPQSAEMPAQAADAAAVTIAPSLHQILLIGVSWRVVGLVLPQRRPCVRARFQAPPDVDGLPTGARDLVDEVGVGRDRVPKWRDGKARGAEQLDADHLL